MPRGEAPDLGAGWVDRIEWLDREGDGARYMRAGGSRPPKRKTDSEFAAVMRRGSARSHAARRITRALDGALPEGGDD